MQNNSNPSSEAHVKVELITAILKTLKFFDLFDFPLTLEELEDYLYKYKQPLHIKELQGTLEYLIDEGKLVFLKGYYLFPGRESIIETRKARKFIAEKLWNRTKLNGQYMRAVPFVKMIAVCNNVAYDNPTEQSDIDLFVVVKPGRMWTARFIITLILQFYGVRRHGNKIAGRFCLSFFLTEEKLLMSDFELKPEDPYLAYWVKTLSPIYGEKTFDMFKEKNRSWLLSYGLDFSEDQKRNMYFYQERKMKRFLEWLLGRHLGNLLEWLLKKTLKRKTMKGLQKLGPASDVVVSDEILKFHNHDRRKEYYEAWSEL